MTRQEVCKFVCIFEHVKKYTYLLMQDMHKKRLKKHDFVQEKQKKRINIKKI